MSCYIEDNEGQRTVTAVLRFSRRELLYDIRNCAWIEGHGMGDVGEDGHGRHIIQDIGDEGNIDRVSRVLSLAVAQVREMLYVYTSRAVLHTDLDNGLKEPQTYGIVLGLPQGFSQTSLNLLEKLIHEYLVCRVLADWLSMTWPEKAQMWAVKAEQAREEIAPVMQRRSTPIRRRGHPF